MKCKNCGWPNRPGEKNCIKCGAPLEAAPNQNLSGHNPTVVNNPEVPGNPQGVGGSPKEPGPMPPIQPQPAPRKEERNPGPRPVAPVNPNVCPRCGYPLRPGMTECPNCLYRIAPASRPAPRPANPAVAPIPQGTPAPAAFTPAGVRAVPTGGPAANPSPQQPKPQGGHHRPTIIGFPEATAPAPQPARQAPAAPHAPAAGDPSPAQGAKYRGTVNVYTAAAPETTPKFTLSPVQKVNEAEAPATLKFEGQEAILNRANTDPENLSITSRQQASIAKRDGKWVITDLSDQQTTFIHPANGHELHDGDMILLGNRLFIFHE